MNSIELVINYLRAQDFVVDKINLGSGICADSYLRVSLENTNRFLLFSSRRVSSSTASRATREITADKTKSYDLAKSLGIKIPDTILITSETDATNYKISKMLEDHTSLVVKPYNGKKSIGMSLDLKDIDKVEKAIQKAFRVSDSVLVQSQVIGEEYRFIMIDGDVRAVLLREKPFVVGDGEKTIADLIEQENELRKKITDSLVPYPLLDSSLIDAGLIQDQRIPRVGERVELSRATMIRNGASVYDVLDKVHKSYIDIANRFAGCLPGRVMSIDIITDDISTSADGSNYSFIESNLGMSLTMCYSCRDSSHFSILEDHLGPMILELLRTHGVTKESPALS